MTDSSKEYLKKAGAFNRSSSLHRDVVEEDGEFPPEAGRYHLYISYACPWACRALAAIYLKGLEDVIGLSVTHPTWGFTRPGLDSHAGWQFTNPSDPPITNPAGYGSFGHEGVIPDPNYNVKFIRDLYEMANSPERKYTVPLLWDKKTKKIVNNESADLLRIFNFAFNKLAKNPELDLYPKALRERIEEVNDWVYPQINDGVYRCGFAKTQDAYEMAFKNLFSGLDKAEEILKTNRYLCGTQLTEADVRLFVTLIRFDVVYVVYFKTNKRFINQYPAIREFTKELYQMPAIRKSVNLDHIKTHYFTSHPVLNTYAIVPVGPDPWWETSHNRGNM